MNRHEIAFAAAALFLWSIPASGQWVEFVEESWRLDAPAALVGADPDEKDYAWGDLDGDGDIDLVIARKEPFTTTGRRVNVLLMNEDGVLTDRTAQYAAASDVPGDQGFLTPTNDRDIAVADLNGDGWLDVVTATALTDNEAKHLSHPRVYINLGEVDGIWQGLRHEDGRIPTMHPVAGPRFAAVSAGDVTGDGAPDLYFSDYDDGPPQIFDYNDRLLVNDGNGFFTDGTAARLTAEMVTSNFGIANAIADMNGDGVNDIVRLTSNGTPYHVAISYNNPASEGFFNLYDPIYALSPYHVAVGHLNNDGLLDVVAIDDGLDRYLLNQGNDGLNRAIFDQFPFPAQTNVINAGNVIIADLDEDGWNDVIVCDVDITIAGCNHRTFIFRNLGNGPDVTFAEQDQVIPDAELFGVYDAAVFDLDGNGRLDIVLGRCSGTQVWMGQAPAGIDFTYPAGRPDLLAPGQTTTFTVDLAIIGGGDLVPGSAAALVSTNGGPFTSIPLVPVAGDTWEVTLPASSCLDVLDYYLTGTVTEAGPFTDPAGAPGTTYRAVAATGTAIALQQNFEGPSNDWSVVNDPSLTSGEWERADPVGTIDGVNLAAPENDATPGFGTQAFITGNGLPGGAAAASDVDGGPTWLLSPVLDLSGSDATIRYARWAYTFAGSPDALLVEISNDGGASWTLVESVTQTGELPDTAWETSSFLVSDFVSPTAQVQVRFAAADSPNDSITEAGVDDVLVEAFVCAAPCPADTDGSGAVDISDLLGLLGAWGTGDPVYDLAPEGNPDGTVNIQDLLLLLSSWGPCP